MADVNEEIVAQYLARVRKWLYVVDVPFKVPKNYSNIDLIAFDPGKGKFYDIEVKYRSAYTMSAKNRGDDDIAAESVKWLVDEFVANRQQREDKLREFTHEADSVKVLVTTKALFGASSRKRGRLEQAFRDGLQQKGIGNSDIWYFDDMIPELVQHTAVEGRYDTELLQAIRMLKQYWSPK